MSTNANALPTKGAPRVTAVKAASFRVDGKGRGFRPSTTEDLRRAGIDAALSVPTNTTSENER